MLSAVLSRFFIAAAWLAITATASAQTPWQKTMLGLLRADMDRSLSVQGRSGKGGVRVDVVEVVVGWGCVCAGVGAGVVRAGARAYLGPRPRGVAGR